MRIAVVDLGTNSTRLLVADVDATGDVREIVRETNVTRLGEGVDRGGTLSPGAIERVARVVGRYGATIAKHDVTRAAAVATSAVREASNGDELVDAVQLRLGVEPRVIGGEEEGRLTFRGATNAQATGARTVVIDIGGGSTELIAGTPGGDPDLVVSTRAGSVRHGERYLDENEAAPPDALRDLRADVRRTIDLSLPKRAPVQAGIAVAGTPTSLAAIEQRLEPYDPAKVQDHVLTRSGCERMLTELAALDLADRRALPGLHPDRAPTIIAGTAILVEALDAFGLPEITVSERDILHGAALELAIG